MVQAAVRHGTTATCADKEHLGMQLGITVQLGFQLGHTEACNSSSSSSSAQVGDHNQQLCFLM